MIKFLEQILNLSWHFLMGLVLIVFGLIYDLALQKNSGLRFIEVYIFLPISIVLFILALLELFKGQDIRPHIFLVIVFGFSTFIFLRRIILYKIF